MPALNDPTLKGSSRCFSPGASVDVACQQDASLVTEYDIQQLPNGRHPGKMRFRARPAGMADNPFFLLVTEHGFEL